MIRIYLIVFCFSTILLSCKEEGIKKEFSGTDKWWHVKCIDLPTNLGAFTIQGTIDHGNFYFHSNGTYSTKPFPYTLEYCEDATKYLISPTGLGTPFGDPYVVGLVSDSTWTYTENTIDIKGKVNWKIINLDDKIMTIQSSKTDYNYTYTLISE